MADGSDIVERLRAADKAHLFQLPPFILIEAAAEIERLRAQAASRDDVLEEAAEPSRLSRAEIALASAAMDWLMEDDKPKPPHAAALLSSPNASRDDELADAHGALCDANERIEELEARVSKLWMTAVLVSDNELATAQDALETIQATLRHRQQPQDTTFHRGLHALRDARQVLSRLKEKPHG